MSDDRELHIHIHSDPSVERKLDQILDALQSLGDTLMSAISDFAAKQSAFNADVSADLDAIQTAIAALNATITQLQNSPGTVTPADQALIDKLVTDGAALATKADTLAGKTPPTPPAGP
jgi:hypothetical protein